MFFPWQNLSAPLSQQLGHDWCCSLNCHLLKVLWKTWTIGVEHTFTSQSLLCSCPVQLCADISEANSAFLSSRLFLTAAWAAPCQAGLEGLSYRHRKVQVVCKVTRSESMKPGAQDGTEKPRRIRVLVCVLLTLMLKQGWVLQRRTEACWQPAWGEFSSLHKVKGFVFLCTKQRTARSSGLCTKRFQTPQSMGCITAWSGWCTSGFVGLQRNWTLDHLPWGTNQGLNQMASTFTLVFGQNGQ